MGKIKSETNAETKKGASMEWVIGIGVLWLLAAMAGKSSPKSSSESNAQEQRNWLANLEQATIDAARQMSQRANEAEEEARSRLIFADLECELELHRADQTLCIKKGTELLGKSENEANDIRSPYLEAFRILSQDESEPARVPPTFNGIEFLKFEIRLDQLFIANQTTNEARNELLERKHRELLRSARLLARVHSENFRTIHLGRFYQGACGDATSRFSWRRQGHEA